MQSSRNKVPHFPLFVQRLALNTLTLHQTFFSGIHLGVFILLLFFLCVCAFAFFCVHPFLVVEQADVPLLLLYEGDAFCEVCMCGHQTADCL